MDKVRITEIAKELGMKSKDVIEKAVDLGLDVKSASSSIATDDAEKLMNYVLTGENVQHTKPAQTSQAPEVIKEIVKNEVPMPTKEVEVKKVVQITPVVEPKTKTLKENANQYYKLYTKSKNAGLKFIEMNENSEKEKEYFEGFLKQLDIFAKKSAQYYI